MIEWTGEIHEFLSVYKQNMLKFQNAVNDWLSWLDTDLLLGDGLSLNVDLNELDSVISRKLYNQMKNNYMTINKILNKIARVLNNSDYQKYDNDENLVAFLFTTNLNDELVLNKDNYNNYYRQLQTVLDELAEFKHENISDEYLKGGEN